MRRSFLCGVLVSSLVLTCATAAAQSLKVSIGIRENDSPGAIFGDGGGSGAGIEWVNRDGQTLTADGTWQLFTFTPATDPLLAFAGTTANSTLEPGIQFSVLEHIRLLNNEGITAPIRIWIDDVTNSVAGGPVVEGFEPPSALGSEVMFQEPRFSGSTSSNLLAGSTTAVSDLMAHSGSQSLQLDLQFVDDTDTRWARVSSFSAPNLPNPRIRVREATGGPASVSFYAKMQVVPEPGALAMLGPVGLALAGRRRRRRPSCG